MTTHGNISIESPIANPHVDASRYEGYTVCDSGGLAGYDARFNEFGFGAATIAQPNGANKFPLTITRSTVNWKLTQTFARDAAERDFTITMTLKNISGASRASVYMWRYFDADLDGSSSNVFDDTIDSVYGRDDYLFGSHGLSLTLGSNTVHETLISTYGGASTSLLAGSCSLGGVVAGPTPAGDYVGVAYYFWPSIAANATKTVKFTYRVL